ncbi:hypothetical protein Zm00014a_031499 [Zea mays]|uniref:Uncharacterized protein n=1 Tax=Zea mays TaxID=4577 RepID=A0A317YAR1_MAIZE|nr:hypothetical protein Zm00014a_031499 [Zea mays]
MIHSSTACKKHLQEYSLQIH